MYIYFFFKSSELWHSLVIIFYVVIHYLVNLLKILRSEPGFCLHALSELLHPTKGKISSLDL